MNTKLYIKITLVSLLLAANSLSASPKTQRIDSVVTKAMETFNVPGVSIGIIEDGKVIHLKGYGISNIDNGQAVDKDTIFKIASNSKAFTAAALAILVDQGKLKWRDKVTQYLPNFQMYDPWVTKEFNIIDLLTHRSGLGIGSGDLMLWPEPTKFNRTDIINNLRYLKPVASFRDKYAYDNLLYIVAGEVVSAITKMPWKDFVEQNIFRPLDMQQCFAGGIDTNTITNLVAPHVIIDEKLEVNIPNLINNKTSLMAAAGGIKCSANDLLKWVNVQLQAGRMENGDELFSATQRNTMWKPVTRLSISAKEKQIDNTHYRGYALGWRVKDVHGNWEISHTGTLSGSMSKIVLLPDQQVGIVILTNQQSSSAREALYKGILQEFIKVEKVDWVDFYVAANKARKTKQNTADSDDIIISPDEVLITKTKIHQSRLGKYDDPWFGEITLSRDNEQIIFQAEKSPRLVGKIYYYNENQWWVKWDDRSFEVDSWLTFITDPNSRKIKLSIEKFPQATDWSFDFEDLDFTHR